MRALALHPSVFPTSHTLQDAALAACATVQAEILKGRDPESDADDDGDGDGAWGGAGGAVGGDDAAPGSPRDGDVVLRGSAAAGLVVGSPAEEEEEDAEEQWMARPPCDTNIYGAVWPQVWPRDVYRGALRASAEAPWLVPGPGGGRGGGGPAPRVSSLVVWYELVPPGRVGTRGGWEG